MSVSSEPLWETHEFRSCVEQAHRYTDLDTSALLTEALAAQGPHGYGHVAVEATTLMHLIHEYQALCEHRDWIAGMGERVAEELFLLGERWTRHVILGRCVCHDGPGACKGPDPD